MDGGRVVVRLLGTVEVVAGGVLVSANRPLERAFAARLAMARGEAVPDRVLARDLWGADDLARPAERLRVVASRLRRGVGDQALRRTTIGYALDAAPVDLVAVEQAMDSGAIRTALDQWRGDSLEDLRGIPFGAAEGERLDALRLRLQLDWIEIELERGTGGVTDELERLAARHPLHERVVRLAALALHRAGQKTEALARLTELRNTLVDKLGLDPTPQTQALETRLREQAPQRPSAPVGLYGADGVPSEYDAGRAPGVNGGGWVRPTGVPGLAVRSRLVGRDEELAALVARLAEPGLVTLVGGPGVGKTRLAWEAARAVPHRPVAWLDLSQIPTAERLESTLVTVEALSGALLVLDNAEHLVDAVAALVTALRWKTNDISVLVTSRQPLRVTGEEEHSLGPLNRHDARNLFNALARRGDAADVEKICGAVDRLPLGIELAAGMTRTLTVQQVAQDVDRLRGSLKAALDWSHELLDQPSRTVFRRLAVFQGGCTLEAAEQVVTGDGIEAADVAPLLSELSDRRLLTIEGAGDVRRFGMLETVRAYATDLLRNASDEPDVRRRHTNWCIRTAEAADRFGHGGTPRNQAEVVRELDAEEPNLRAAIEHGDRVIEIAAPLWWYWWYRNRIDEARTWLRQAVETASEQSRAVGLHALAGLTRVGRDHEEAARLGREALAIFREHDNSARITRTLLELSLTSLALEDLDTALDYAKEARDRAEADEDERCRGAALYRIGLVHQSSNQTNDAVRVWTEALECWQRIDYRHGVSVALGNLAHATRDQSMATKSLEQAREIGFTEGRLDAISILADLAAHEGRPAVAAWFRAVVEHRRGR